MLPLFKCIYFLHYINKIFFQYSHSNCLTFMKMSQTLSFLQIGFIFFKCNFGLKYDHDTMRLTRVSRSTFTTHVHTYTLLASI